MIPHGVEVYIGLTPIDLRWGFDRLAGLVQHELGKSPRSGALFIFLGRRGHSLKVLFFDGTGMCIFYKRLDRGTFRLPVDAGDCDPGAVCIEVEERVLDELLDGIHLETKAPPRSRRRPTH